MVGRSPRRSHTITMLLTLRHDSTTKLNLEDLKDYWGAFEVFEVFAVEKWMSTYVVMYRSSGQRSVRQSTTLALRTAINADFAKLVLPTTTICPARRSMSVEMFPYIPLPLPASPLCATDKISPLR